MDFVKEQNFVFVFLCRYVNAISVAFEMILLEFLFFFF